MQPAWEFDLDAAAKAIREHSAKRVLLQLPDGLKAHAKDIADALASTGAELFIWTESNYGACDLPLEARNAGIDLILHFGHEAWRYERPNATIAKPQK